MGITRRTLVSGATLSAASAAVPFSGALAGLQTTHSYKPALPANTRTIHNDIGLLLADMKARVDYMCADISRNDEKAKYARKREAVDDINLAINLHYEAQCLFRRADALRRLALIESAVAQEARREPKYGRLMKVDNIAYERLRRLEKLGSIAMRHYYHPKVGRCFTMIDEECRAIQGDFGVFVYRLLKPVRPRACIARAEYRKFAADALKRRLALTPDTPMNRYSIAALQIFEETMERLALGIGSFENETNAMLSRQAAAAIRFNVNP